MTADIVRYSVALKGKKVRSQTNPDIIFHSNSCLGQIRSCFFHAKLYRVNPVLLLKKNHMLLAKILVLKKWGISNCLCNNSHL